MEPVNEDRLAEIEAAQRALREHPGQERRRDLDALWISIDQVMIPNLRELLALVRQPGQDPDLFDELIQNVRPPVVRERYRGEVTRRLANYIASALALVDHVRRLTRESEAPYMDEFRRRRQAVARQAEIGFVQDLRNFTLHRRLPVFAHTASLHIEGDEQRTDFAVTVDSRDLLGWSGWSAGSRRFIEANADGVELDGVLKRHGDLMIDLNTWVHDQMQLEFEPMRKELNALIRQYNAALFDRPEDEIDAYIRERLEGMGAGPWNPDED